MLQEAPNSALWNVPSLRSGQALRGRFAAPQDEDTGFWIRRSAHHASRKKKENNVSFVTRRNFVKGAAAGLAAPALLRGARAAEPLKVGYIYLGPIGDYGWTWAHEKGRKAMVDALKGQVVTSYVENVKEDASAAPILKDLAQQGHKLIFTTS